MYIWLTLLVWFFALILVNGALLIGTWTQPPSNPLSPYVYLLNSDYDDLAVRSEFDCNHDIFLPGATLAQHIVTSVRVEVCVYTLADGPFPQVVVSTSSVNFTVRDNTLVVGDLAFLWGKPAICASCPPTLVRIRWAEVGVIAYAQPVKGQLSYFSPVERIFFSNLDGRNG
jgi:hypothetical protein